MEKKNTQLYRLIGIKEKNSKQKKGEKEFNFIINLVATGRVASSRVNRPAPQPTFHSLHHSSLLQQLAARSPQLLYCHHLEHSSADTWDRTLQTSQCRDL